jgi:hypothetical protein
MSHGMDFDRVILVHQRDNTSVTVRREARYRSTPEWSVNIQSADPLRDGYDEATARLDDLSIRRLLHFLTTGESPTRGQEGLPPLPECWARHEADVS